MVQKTVRFYEESSEDASALEILNDHKKYGYNSCREMIIAALNLYSQKSLHSSGNIDIESLAEKIASKLNLNIASMGSETHECKLKEGEYDNRNNEENYHKALSFMESL